MPAVKRIDSPTGNVMEKSLIDAEDQDNHLTIQSGLHFPLSCPMLLAAAQRRKCKCMMQDTGRGAAEPEEPQTRILSPPFPEDQAAKSPTLPRFGKCISPSSVVYTAPGSAPVKQFCRFMQSTRPLTSHETYPLITSHNRPKVTIRIEELR